MSHPGIANLLPLGFFMLLTLKWDKIQVCYQVTWPNGEIPLNLIMRQSINRVLRKLLRPVKFAVWLSLVRQLLKVNNLWIIFICNNVSLSVNKIRHKCYMSSFLVDKCVAIKRYECYSCKIFKKSEITWVMTTAIKNVMYTPSHDGSTEIFDSQD